MVGEVEQQSYGERFFSDINTRIRDLEDKQSLLRDRMMLISESFVKERDKNFEEIQDLKKVVLTMEEDNKKIKDLMIRMNEMLNKTARKDELMILQRQFNLFRDS
jgi:hypothetical protein